MCIRDSVHAGALRNKVGSAITLGGTRHGGQETTLLAITNYFLLNEILATGGCGRCYSGGTLWTKDNRKFINYDDEGLVLDP